MSEYVDVAIIENGKVIGSFKSRHVTEENKDKEKAEEYFKNQPHTYADNEEQLKEDIVAAFLKGLNAGRADLKKENEQLRADYDKQKEINKELADDIGALQDELRTAKEHILAANKAYDALALQIKQTNEREAQDIRARFPC